MSMRLSEHAAFTLIETTDIGGTNVASTYVSMKNYARAMAYVEIGTWNATDDLDECRIQQATDVDGGSVTNRKCHCWLIAPLPIRAEGRHVSLFPMSRRQALDVSL